MSQPSFPTHNFGLNPSGYRPKLRNCFALAFTCGSHLHPCIALYLFPYMCIYSLLLSGKTCRADDSFQAPTVPAHHEHATPPRRPSAPHNHVRATTRGRPLTCCVHISTFLHSHTQIYLHLSLHNNKTYSYRSRALLFDPCLENQPAKPPSNVQSSLFRSLLRCRSTCRTDLPFQAPNLPAHYEHARPPNILMHKSICTYLLTTTKYIPVDFKLCFSNHVPQT